MQVWQGLGLREHLFHHGVVTIGNFDGLHLGHQSLLQQASRVAPPRVVITFDPHPLQILHPERRLNRLFPREDLVEQLPRYGVDLLLILPFDREFAQHGAVEFLQQFVEAPFRPRHIVAGYDFAFGNNREGTLALLEQWAKARAIQVDVSNPLRVGGEIVSSRRIREAIVKGDVHGASLLLGRPFYLRGEVVAGAGRGSRIGIPTLNQKVVNETLPLGGVYASQVRKGGQILPSVTNIGTNPTFSGSEMKVETHVLGTRVDWRGQTIDVDLLERLREERKFDSVEKLVEQIHSDIRKAQAMWGAKS